MIPGDSESRQTFGVTNKTPNHKGVFPTNRGVVPTPVLVYYLLPTSAPKGLFYTREKKNNRACIFVPTEVNSNSYLPTPFPALGF